MQSETPKGGWLRCMPRLLLIIPLVTMLWVPSYNTLEPKLADIPFFYWYQLAWILIGAALIAIVYLIEIGITRRAK